MNNDRRPSTPNQVARELRQRAGFGCCRCGSPILQYHHIIPYSVEKHFRVEDMMALCPGCHDMATKGALITRKQREHQASPYNIQRGYTGGILTVNGPYCAIQMGGNYVVTTGPIISVDGNPLLSLTVGPANQLELSVKIYDKNDNIVATIEKNEWVSGDVELWDIRADYQKLTINKKHGQIELEINTQKDYISIKARLWYKQQSIRLNSMGLFFNGSIVQSVSIKDLAFVNQSFELNTANKTLSIVPRENDGLLISEPQPNLRLQMAVDAWNDRYAGRFINTD